MSENLTCLLEDRAVIELRGEDARALLQGLVSVDMERLSNRGNIFGALLSPQGKIQFDFFIHAAPDALLIDIAQNRADDFLKRMMLYRLRSKVELKNVSNEKQVMVEWPAAVGHAPDARLAALGARYIVEGTPATTATPAAYHAHRLSLGVPEGGRDFAFDDLFPHDAMMDALHGVDFHKGCYVGQEVVSRVHHRASARKRFHILKAENARALPNAGEAIMIADKSVGTLGSSSGPLALGLLRIDKIEGSDAKLRVGDVEITASLPDYFIRFQAGKAA